MILYPFQLYFLTAAPIQRRRERAANSRTAGKGEGGTARQTFCLPPPHSATFYRQDTTSVWDVGRTHQINGHSFAKATDKTDSVACHLPNRLLLPQIDIRGKFVRDVSTVRVLVRVQQLLIFDLVTLERYAHDK